MKTPIDKKTEYHGGWYQIARLHDIKAALGECTVGNETSMERNELVTSWKRTFGLLKAFYKEIRPKLSKEEQGKHDEKMKLHYMDMKSSLRQGERISLGFLDNFDEWEMELRDLEEQYGYSMPDVDPNKAMEA